MTSRQSRQKLLGFVDRGAVGTREKGSDPGCVGEEILKPLDLVQVEQILKYNRRVLGERPCEREDAALEGLLRTLQIGYVARRGYDGNDAPVPVVLGR